MTITKMRSGSRGDLLRIGLYFLAANFNSVAYAAFVADAEYAATPGLATINAAVAYNLGITGAGTLIGVIDSGINPDHQEFGGAIAAGFNFSTGSAALSDSSATYHGSHVSGTVAARRDGSGMQGVAYDAGLVIGGTSFYVDQLASAINYAVGQHADVLNNSWGYSGTTVLSYDKASIEASYPDLLSALQNAVAQNTVVVFASGNDGYADPQLFAGLPYYFPELQKSWITVAASTMDGVYFTPYSNRCGVAVQWCVVAPGGYNGYDAGVYSVDGATSTGYKSLYGTSNATPYVSGAVALLAQRFPYMTANQLTSVLLTTAKHGTDAVLSPIYGRGEIDIGKAMNGPAALEFTFDVDTQGYDSVWSNNIIGSGSLIKRGTGVLELTGSNSFTGGVTLVGGSLRVASDSNLGSASGGLDFDGGLLQVAADLSLERAVTVGVEGGTLDTQAWQVTLTDAFHGTGVLHKEGSGTLLLAGSSDFTGILQINAGTVQTSSHNFTGDIVNFGTLIFDQSDTGSFAGSISGSGTLVKQGIGELQLTGTNTYSGGTVVAAGVLTGAGAALQGDILNNASVVFDQSVDGIYAGSMSGSGALVKRGSATLKLAGNNSYFGGTLIEAGQLEGDAASLQGNFSGNGTLIFNQSGEAVFGGEFSSLAAVQKLGAGTLHLAGSGNSAQHTTVLAGTLAVDTSLTSDIQVLGGTLAIAGDVAGTVAVAEGGTLAIDPTVTGRIGGDLQMSSGATLAVQVEAGASRVLNVEGTVSVAGGAVQVNASGDFPALMRQSLVTAQAVQGRFDSISTDQPSLQGFLQYETGAVNLVLARTDSALIDKVLGFNRQQAANGIRGLLASGYYSDGLAAYVNTLYQATPAAATKMLDTVSGELVADATHVLLDMLANSALAPMLGRSMGNTASNASLLPGGWTDMQAMADGDEDNENPGAWIQRSSQHTSVEASTEAGGYDSSQRLLAFGADVAALGGGRVGLMLAQGDSDLQRDGLADRLDSTLNLIGAYGHWRHGSINWLGVVQVGRFESDSQRWIEGGSPAKAVGHSRQNLFTSTLAMRYGLLPFIQPLAVVNYVHLSQPGFTETGSSSLVLSYAARQQDFLNSQAGVAWHFENKAFPAGMRAGMQLLWQHDFSSDDAYIQSTAFSVSPDATFALQPSGAGTDRAVLQAGLEYAVSQRLQVSLRGHAERGSGLSAAGAGLAFDFMW